MFDRENEAFKNLFAGVLDGLLLLIGTAAFLQLHDILRNAYGIARAYPELRASFYVNRRYDSLHVSATVARELEESKLFFALGK